MPTIRVNRVDGERFRVEIEEGATSTAHEVTARPEHVDLYGPGVEPERLIQASFEFLLEREPKESILARFELPVIERYFPEYPVRIRERLD